MTQAQLKDDPNRVAPPEDFSVSEKVEEARREQIREFALRDNETFRELFIDSLSDLVIDDIRDAWGKWDFADAGRTGYVKFLSERGEYVDRIMEDYVSFALRNKLEVIE